jgi:hypothetical protein
MGGNDEHYIFLSPFQTIVSVEWSYYKTNTWHIRSNPTGPNDVAVVRYEFNGGSRGKPAGH